MTDQNHEDQLKRTQELVEKARTPAKLTFEESKELTTLAKEFNEGGKFAGEEHILLRIDTRNALKKDGFLSQSEIDKARETFATVLNANPGNMELIVEILETGKTNPDARTLYMEYFQAWKTADDALEGVRKNGVNVTYQKEEHTFFGGITGHNKEVDARNHAAHQKAVEEELVKLADAWIQAQAPSMPELMKQDKTLEATLKKLGQTGGVIDDTRSDGSMESNAPTGPNPVEKGTISK